ncbi:uncharacterized protein LOC123670910 [Harmonia axyridis]|uniref:uncharacterized protein LOC123670910 n=1 Tax=Harmonia axyridis TaxID=115357 RepID=UPI001E2770B4|nr:uncharacterized protein LOC123670910 [Harmonia axyridis]
MGTPISSVIAQSVMEHIEQKIMSKYNNKAFFRRYVDDCLLITTPTSMQHILQDFNGAHTLLQFTIEEEKDRTLDFLDMTLINRDNKILTKWKNKKQNSDRILDYYSNHHTGQIRGTIIGYIDRALKLTSPELRPKIIIELKERLIKNNYPTKMTTPIINERIHRLHNLRTTEENKEQKTRIPIPYTKNLSHKITKILKPHNIELVHKPQNQLKEIFTKLKNSTPKSKKSNVVYSIPCKDCDKQYIGQTSQRLHDRLNAHKYTKNATTELVKNLLTIISVNGLVEAHMLENTKRLQLDTYLISQAQKQVILGSTRIVRRILTSS